MLPLVEFTYNNSYHSSIGVTPYEALDGRRCRTPLCWQQDEESMVLGPEFLQTTTEKVRLIQDRMRATQSRQKSYADKRMRPLEFEAGDHVFLRVTPTTSIGRALKSRKLTPRFAVISAALPFGHYFNHNSLHRTPNALVLLLLKTRFTELSFDIKNVIFGPLSRCSLIF